MDQVERMKTLTELTIKRSEWLTPETWQADKCSFLVDARGFKCCLGFACIALGQYKNSIVEECYPSDVCTETNQFANFHQDGSCTNTEFSQLAMSINDNDKITREQRESALVDLFDTHGINLTFVD